jgi:hypothetical protein
MVIVDVASAKVSYVQKGTIATSFLAINGQNIQILAIKNAYAHL